MAIKKSKVLVVKNRSPSFQEQFMEIELMIRQARQKTYLAVNTELVTLYWNVGRYVSCKVESAEWGAGVVEALADITCRENSTILRDSTDAVCTA